TDERAEHILELWRIHSQRDAQRLESPGVQFIEAAAKHLFDEIVLGAEVVVHGGEIDVGRGGDLTQRRTGEPMPGEQRFCSAEDAFLRREVRGVQGSAVRVAEEWPRPRSNKRLNPKAGD